MNNNSKSRKNLNNDTNLDIANRLKRLTLDLSEKNATITNLRAKSNEKNAALAKKNANFENLRVKSNEKNAALAKKNANIENLRAKSNEKNAALAKKNENIAEKNAKISVLTKRDKELLAIWAYSYARQGVNGLSKHSEDRARVREWQKMFFHPSYGSHRARIKEIQNIVKQEIMYRTSHGSSSRNRNAKRESAFPESVTVKNLELMDKFIKIGIARSAGSSSGKRS